MSKFLLDTNIVSDLIKPLPSDKLVVWMGERENQELYFSTISLAEIDRGIRSAPSGKRRTQLESWFHGSSGPFSKFQSRILTFDIAASMVWGRLMAEGDRKGQPRSAMDMMIAAIAEANNCIVVTDNEKDFAGIKFINPMRK